MNFVKSILPKVSEFELIKNQYLIELINQLEDLEHPSDILKTMRKIHHLIKEIIGTKKLLQKLYMSCHDSHAKEVFLSYPTRLGMLRFEKMHFQKGITTILHGHPEFIFDEVIDGSFLEVLFQRNSSGEYEEWKFKKRTKGQIIKVHDTLGYPHTITASEGDCITVCLYLGHEYVKKLL